MTNYKHTHIVVLRLFSFLNYESNQIMLLSLLYVIMASTHTASKVFSEEF